MTPTPSSPLRRLGLATLVLGAGLAASACKPPLHLSYDYGRAFVETLRVQADFSRPSVMTASYHLYGVEAAAIRLRVSEVSSDVQEMETTFQANF